MGVMSDQYLRALLLYESGRYSQRTIDNQQSHARHFLNEIGVKTSYSRQDLLDFVEKMVQAGYRTQSIYTILRSVHALFHANNIPWPLNRRDLYIGSPQSPPATPMLTKEEIVRMIQGVKGARFPDLQLCMLSSLYGFRNQELANIISTGLDGKEIDVQTAKGGRRRVHHIPSALSKYLTFRGKGCKPEAAHKAFERIMDRYVRPPRYREGWHALRRNVVTGLLMAGCSEDVVVAFMGWGKPATVFKYFHPDPQNVDEEVFKVHPFYPEWLKS